MLWWTVAAVAAAGGGTLFQRPQFGSGMILQRGHGTRVFGGNASAAVTVTVAVPGGATVTATSPPPSNGSWLVALPAVSAAPSSVVTATDGSVTDTLDDVAWGEVLLCGGQSNMGFGMCGATVIPSGREHAPQTPTEALAALPTTNPIRFFWQSGDHNGGAGSTVHGNVCRDPATLNTPQNSTWFAVGPSNGGAASAVCLLTAQSLREALGGEVPVGAVESCVGGTPVAEWTPPNGVLYQAHIMPLLPMSFAAVLWDQGERDAKTTNTTFYSTEFPALISGWRQHLQSPGLPFVYVELCHELGAEEPKEADFWQYGQRAALKLPAVGFATTTDIDKSALHPPDKQDIAPRLALEVRRLAWGENVVARGPELLSTTFDGGASELTVKLSNSSLVVTRGVVVPPPPEGCTNQTWGPAVTQVVRGVATPIPFRLEGDSIVARCTPGGVTAPVLINGDAATCFVYSSSSGLPAPPLSLPCSA